MNVIPYEFSETKFFSDSHPDEIKAYYVTLYFLFDGTSCYTFAHQHDLLDNYGLALDMGLTCTVFTKKILVTRYKHSNIFKEIEDYVSSSDYDS